MGMWDRAFRKPATARQVFSVLPVKSDAALVLVPSPDSARLRLRQRHHLHFSAPLRLRGSNFPSPNESVSRRAPGVRGAGAARATPEMELASPSSFLSTTSWPIFPLNPPALPLCRIPHTCALYSLRLRPAIGRGDGNGVGRSPRPRRRVPQGRRFTFGVGPCIVAGRVWLPGSVGGKVFRIHRQSGRVRVD
jgi:hypothetical protein